MAKVFITRHALTAGIQEYEAVDITDTMASVKVRGFTNYYHGEDWHLDRAAAVARAEEMRTRKVASVEKQLARLKATAFS